MNALALVAPAFLAAMLTAFVWRNSIVTGESFHVANRSVGSFMGAVSLGVAWLWVFALFVGPLKAYQDGWPALVWFAIPNTLAICLSCAIAWQIRKRMAGGGCTLPEYLGITYDRSMRNVSVFGILFIQGVYAVLANLVGALILLTAATSFSPFTIVVTLALTMVALASFRGLPNSIGADVLKASLVAAVVLCTLVALYGAGGEKIVAGLNGTRAVPLGLFDTELLVGFALPVSISLLAGGAIDQQLYQRAYALSGKGAGRALVLAPVVFLVLSVGVGMLGFVAASQGLKVGNPQFIGFDVMKSVFSENAGSLFILAVVSILIATGASALNAVSSVGATDIAKAIRPGITDSSLVWVSRSVMVFFIVVCVSIFYYHPKINLVDLLLFIGPFRAALLLPTVMAAFTVAHTKSSRMFTYLIIAAMVAGLLLASGIVPLFSPKTQAFYAGLTTLAITAVACAVEWIRSRTLAL